MRTSLRPLRLATLTLAAALALPVLPAGAQGQDAQTLSRELTQLRGDLRQQQDLVLLLRNRLAEAEAARAWLPWLVLGLGASLALAGWLALRGSRHARSGRTPAAPLIPLSERGDDAAGAPTVFGPAVSGLLNQDSSTAVAQISTQTLARTDPPPVAQPASAGADAAVDAAPAKVADRPRLADAPAPQGVDAPALAGARTGGGARAAEPPLRAGEMTVAGHPGRAVSVEELFDLEQQVDFFLVLGQTESAVDLLVSHIRGTGGNSALPYLKLMEVYRQQGDAESYERTRKRFNQRFNAHAPEWSVNLHAGRMLEDYAEVLGRLQRVWANPLDALAELEALMFRRTRGELFDLPAFRDVLLLHALAIDLHERSPMSASKVDILLPLGEDATGNTAPLPHVVSMASAAMAGARRGQPLPWGGLDDESLDSRPITQPASRESAVAGKVSEFALDLDLSDFAPAPKDYTHPAAFTDMGLRGDFGMGPLAAANDVPAVKPAKPGH